MYASMSRAPAGNLNPSDWSISCHKRDIPSKPTHTRPLWAALSWTVLLPQLGLLRYRTPPDHQRVYLSSPLAR